MLTIPPTTMPTTPKKTLSKNESDANSNRLTASCASHARKMMPRTGPTFAKNLLNPYDNAGPTCGAPAGAPYGGVGGGGGGGGGGGTSDTFGSSARDAKR